MKWEEERAQDSIQAKGRVCMQVQLGRHSLGDLSVEAFQLGMKGSHQLKYFLLGKEHKRVRGKQHRLDIRRQRSGAVLSPGQPLQNCFHPQFEVSAAATKW